MPADAVLEVVPAARLQFELTSKVAARLAPARRRPRKALASQGSTEPSTRAGKVSAAVGKTDAVVEIDGKRYAIQIKGAQLSGSELLRAVHAAAGELLGSSKLYILHQSDPAVTKIVSAVLEQLPDLVARRRQALSERNIEALVDVFLGTDPLTSAMPEVERDNADAQADFLKRWPLLTAEAVAERAEHASSNRSATASRWKRARKIFSVRVSGREAYPAFQFQEGQPRSVIGKVLGALPENLTGWQTAFWFTGPNGWLEGQAPVERLNEEAAVVAAAERERDAWMG